MAERAYASVADVKVPQDMRGVDEAVLLTYLETATDHLEKELGGTFLPLVAARRYDGSGKLNLYIDFLLTVTSIVNDGDTLTTADYILKPDSGFWDNGPVNRILVDPDATLLTVWKNEADAVVITGGWGMYSATEATGEASITFADAVATVLTVLNGSLISVGQVLLIESEQLYVTATGAISDSTANTNGAIDTDDVQITFTDGTKVNAGEIIQINTEDMRIIAISGNDVNVERAYNGTARAAHDDAQDVNVYRKYTVTRGANGTTAAAHSAKALSRYVVPPMVRYITIQIASLMMRKEKTGFQGKSGNVALGEVFYHDEFPTKPIKQVKRDYRVQSL